MNIFVLKLLRFQISTMAESSGTLAKMYNRDQIEFIM